MNKNNSSRGGFRACGVGDGRVRVQGAGYEDLRV